MLWVIFLVHSARDGELQAGWRELKALIPWKGHMPDVFERKVEEQLEQK